MAALLPGITPGQEGSRLPRRQLLLLGAALLLAPLAARSAVRGRTAAGGVKKQAGAADEGSCRVAVQRFYDWYLPRLMREVHVTAMEQAISLRPRDFSAVLRQGLLEDLDAAKKSQDEIVSLDFEPLVNSQDPAGKYVARKVTRVGKSYWVEVHGVVDGKVSAAPDVIPELVRWRGHWTFVNFHYPAVDGEKGTDLLKLLKELRDGRRKQRRHVR